LGNEKIGQRKKGQRENCLPVKGKNGSGKKQLKRATENWSTGKLGNETMRHRKKATLPNFPLPLFSCLFSFPFLP